jgi:hypothetical protein
MSFPRRRESSALSGESMVELIFDENEDWDKRVLCSDESCIGTIGHDGKCKECGKSYVGTLNALANSVNETKTDVSAVGLPDNKNGVSTKISEDSSSDDEWEKRVLCSDGCCTGTIGHDGRCRECGKTQ